jgi:hypothetical protein
MRRFIDSQGSKAKAGAEDDEAADEEPVPPSKKKAAAKATAKKEKSGGDTPAAQAAEEGDASGGYFASIARRISETETEPRRAPQTLSLVIRRLKGSRVGDTSFSVPS